VVRDSEKNILAAADSDVSNVDSVVRVLVIRAQEDWAIAKHCWKIMAAKSGHLSPPS